MDVKSRADVNLYRLRKETISRGCGGRGRKREREKGGKKGGGEKKEKGKNGKEKGRKEKAFQVH